ncbi:MAG: DUF1731 domain-containing protein [Fimbriimonas sp.]|nr:DUF1731 domain-containing protein [Fimbriimonas sp.]
MKIVIPGGSGHIGQGLSRHLTNAGHKVVILSRSGPGIRWDGRTLGAWTREINGADAVINLAGKSVNCRYSDAVFRELTASRVESTKVLGQAIAESKNPPRVWLNASTSTIYRHRSDAPNDEITGHIEPEPGTPWKWVRSLDIALAWEAELEAAPTPRTRKVAMRSAMTMSAIPGSIFDVLCSLCRRGLGGPIAGGGQFVSWVHEADFCSAVDFLIGREDISGPVNICSPNPIPQAEFMTILRETLGVKIGLPAAKWMAEIGAWAMGTETELILKSRRVVPTRLLEAGFAFRFPHWREAAADLSEGRGAGSEGRGTRGG